MQIAKNIMKKQEVKIKIDPHNNIQFYIPSEYAQIHFGKKQKYLSFGAKNTASSMAEAYTTLNILQNDLETGAFSILNLDKYKHSSNKEKIDYVQFEKLDLLGFFDRYVEYYSAFIKPTTLKRYKIIYKNSLLEVKDVNIFTEQGQLKIAQHLMKSRGRGTQYKLLGTLDRMIEWGKENCFIPDNIPNKFRSHSRKAFKLPTKKREQILFLKDVQDRQLEYGAWTIEERNLIIETILTRKMITNKFLCEIDVKGLLYEFFFLTGIRHEEGFALNWGNVTYKNNLTYIRIDKVYTHGFLINETKNGKVRNIPLQPRAAEIIEQIRTAYSKLEISMGKDDLVFRNTVGGYLRISYMDRIWRGYVPRNTLGCVTQLVIDGKLPHYIEPYSTRRTFISLELQNGADLKSVADYVGDTPETLLKHYYFGNKNYIPKI